MVNNLFENKDQIQNDEENVIDNNIQNNIIENTDKKHLDYDVEINDDHNIKPKYHEIDGVEQNYNEID